MLTFNDAAAIALAPTHASIDPALQRLIADRVHDWAATDLLDLTHLMIVQPGDTEQDIIDRVAFSPLVNPLDGERWGTKAFTPHWDWLEAHGSWFELMVTYGDGFACFLFIPDSEGVDPELRKLCHAYVGREP
jgi:hypothetical protein